MKPIKEGDNRGTTLAEMIVTFALIGIFLAAAAAVISSAVVLHGELTTSMYAQSVGEMLLDKITGELAAAQPEGEKALVIVNSETAPQDNAVLFYDKNGKPVHCMTRNGLMVLHYLGEEMIDGQEIDIAFNELESLEEPVGYEWGLDEKAYMGFRITELQIQRLTEENVLEVTLTVQSLKTGYVYTASRVTRCYNFKTRQDYGRIVEG